MKIKNISDNDMTIRLVDFPAGKSVEVDDAGLLEKCLAMPQFEQVKRKAKKNDQDPA